MSIRMITGALVVVSVSLAGCDGEAEQAPAAAAAAPVTATADAGPALDPFGRPFQTSLDDFPAWLPLPAEYVVILDSGIGEYRTAVIETGGDVRDVVRDLNARLPAAGDARIAQVADEAGRYVAQGVITHNGSVVVINVGEYDVGGAMKAGNTTSVSYQIGG
jgi:hypothetical protein